MQCSGLKITRLTEAFSFWMQAAIHAGIQTNLKISLNPCMVYLNGFIEIDCKWLEEWGKTTQNNSMLVLKQPFSLLKLSEDEDTSQTKRIKAIVLSVFNFRAGCRQSKRFLSEDRWDFWEKSSERQTAFGWVKYCFICAFSLIGSFATSALLQL